tara:strand:- start:430 stop:3096 length:2667 start_codon:yes stop_codon:yes gene_type:complete
MKTQISLQSTSVRPLFRDFEEAGMAPALGRGTALLNQHCGGALVNIPDWLTDLNFGNAFFNSDIWSIGALVHELRGVEARLRQQAVDLYGATWKVNSRVETTAALPAWAAFEEEAQMRMVLALGRLALGAAIEAAFALEDCRRRGASPSPPPTPPTPPTPPRMYNDALLIAVWTSAHAEYVSYIQSGVEEPPFPSVHSFPNSTCEFDFGGLFCMRPCTRMCPKSALPLLQMFQRALNPGSRGWTSLLDAALQESVSTRYIVVNAMIVNMVGMHSMLPPSKRAPWNLRMLTQRTLQHTLTDSEAKRKLAATATATKEGVRRLVATFLAASPALVEGLSATNHGIMAMLSPPFAPASNGMSQLSETLAACGLEIAMSTSKDTDLYVSTLNRDFEADGSGTPWDAGWLSKTSPSTNKTPCINLLSDIWSSCFRANFVAFWAHATTHQARASRLDAAQHRAIHSLNAVTKLVEALPQQQQLQAQRRALELVSSSLLTVNEVAGCLGIEAPGSQIRNIHDSLKFFLAVGPEAAARMFVFARTAWVSEELLIVELGCNTRQMQINAIFKRLKRPVRQVDLSDLPVQATHVHICMECRRVSSAHFLEPGKPGQTFTELGTSSSMLCTECDGVDKGKTHILCAKRSSAALRTALSIEDAVKKEEVEGKPVNLGAVSEILDDGRIGSAGSSDDAGAGLATRIRRDAKAALEQRSRAYACGEQKMVKVPIIGRAIRIFGEWYALCSLCGGMLRVLPMHRYGSEICCCRCDAQMLGLPAPTPPEQRAVLCRFCNAVDPERKSNRWKMVKAPLDTNRENAKIPPALRQVFYCPKHYRPWVTAAHRVLQTRIILSHIAHNAKPIHSTAVQRTAEELGFEEVEKKKRKRKGGTSEEDAKAGS